MLVSGTPSSAIAPNIAAHVALTSPHVIIYELPSNSYIRNYRTVFCIIGETMTADRLANANNWQQLFTGGTSRRQAALQNLTISVIEDDELRPLVLSSAIIVEGETSEQQHDAVLGTILRGGQRLQRWRETIEEMYPTYVHDIPRSDDMNISKLHFCLLPSKWNPMGGHNKGCWRMDVTVKT